MAVIILPMFALECEAEQTKPKLTKAVNVPRLMREGGIVDAFLAEFPALFIFL